MSELGAIKEALNDKMDRDLGNMGEMDYVVEWKAPTASDPTWYRKYKSGWVEQGGFYQATAQKTWNTITFQKPFANSSYSLTFSQADDGDNGGSNDTQYYNAFRVYQCQSDNFQISCGQSELPLCRWYACGQGAE